MRTSNPSRVFHPSLVNSALHPTPQKQSNASHKQCARDSNSSSSVNIHNQTHLHLNFFFPLLTMIDTLTLHNINLSSCITLYFLFCLLCDQLAFLFKYKWHFPFTPDKLRSPSVYFHFHFMSSIFFVCLFSNIRKSQNTSAVLHLCNSHFVYTFSTFCTSRRLRMLISTCLYVMFANVE